MVQYTQGGESDRLGATGEEIQKSVLWPYAVDRVVPGFTRGIEGEVKRLQIAAPRRVRGSSWEPSEWG